MALGTDEHYEDGFVRDSEGRLVLVVAGGSGLEEGQAYETGFVRDADGRLVVTVASDYIAVPAPPADGDYTLTSSDGTVSWGGAGVVPTTQLVTGQVSVSATPTPLTTDKLELGSFILRAHPDNDELVEFGEVGVTAGHGYPLSAGETFQFVYSIDAGEAVFDRQPQDIYVLGTSGDKVAFVGTGRV